MSSPDEALTAARQGVFWWTGDAIHQGNIVLGRLALRRGDVEEARRALLAAGADPDALNPQTKTTALDVAKSRGDQPMVTLLENHPRKK